MSGMRWKLGTWMVWKNLIPCSFVPLLVVPEPLSISALTSPATRLFSREQSRYSTAHRGDSGSEESFERAVGDGILVNRTFTQIFEDSLPSWLLQRCMDFGWEFPTRIQEKALSAILLDGSDVIVQAETGENHEATALPPSTLL